MKTCSFHEGHIYSLMNCCCGTQKINKQKQDKHQKQLVQFSHADDDLENGVKLKSSQAKRGR